MRLSFIFPLLLSAAVFVLSILVLLAGKDPNFLTPIYILKVTKNYPQINTSNIKISKSIIFTTTSSLSLPSSITNIINQLPSSEINRVAQTAAKELGLRDFYTAHIMTYCEGFDFVTDNRNFTSSSSTSSSNSTEEKTTFCSNPKAMFMFDPIKVFETQLIPGVSISDLNIPSEVQTGIKAVGIAYKIMFITYIVGIALSGVMIILTALSGWIESRLVVFFLGLLCLISSFALIVASSIGTAIAIKLRNVFNQYMIPNLNVSAQSSAGYLGMTWASVGCSLLVVIYWCGMCCCGGSRKGWKRRERAGRMDMAENKGWRERGSGEERLVANGPAEKETPRYS